MNKKNVFCFILTLFWISGTFTPMQAALKIQEVKAGHNVKAWLVENHTLPIVALALSFKGGYAYGPADKAGLVNMMRLMLDEGAGPYNSQQFTEKRQKLAIEMRFDCTHDTLNIMIKTTTAHLQEACALLKYALTQPRFDVERFNKVRDSQLTALQIQEKTPDYLVLKTFYETVMGSHPYSLLKSGTQQTLKSLTPQDLKDFAKKVFARDTLTVGVCGDITPEQLKTVLDSLSQDLPEQSPLPSLPSFNPSLKGEIKTVQANFPQSQVLFTQKGLSSRDPHFIELALLNQILGASPNSRLFSEVRVKRGNAYHVSTNVDNWDQAFLFSGEFGSDNARVLDNTKLIREIWQQMKEKGISTEELDNAKSFLQGSFALNLRSSPQIASLLHTYQRLGYPIDYPEKRAKLIQDITLEQMNNFARQFLNPEALTFIIVGQPKTSSTVIETK